MKVDIEIFNDWHPRFEIASGATSEYFRLMCFTPDFINNAITYIVSIRDNKKRIIKEFEFEDLKSALDCYNNFEEEMINDL